MREKGAFLFYSACSVYHSHSDTQLYILNKSIIQQYLRPLADLLIELIQLIVRQVMPAMLLHAERQQMAQLFSVFRRHFALSSSNKVIIHTRQKRTNVFLQQLFLCTILIASVIEERIAMVKQRRGRNDLICPVIHKKTKVAKMPVRIADNGIKDDHIPKCLLILRPKFLIIRLHSIHAAARDKTPNRDI